MKIVSLILLSLFSLSALAHTGHGETSAFAHDLEHLLWYAAPVVLIAIAFVVFRKSQ